MFLFHFDKISKLSDCGNLEYTVDFKIVSHASVMLSTCLCITTSLAHFSDLCLIEQPQEFIQIIGGSYLVRSIAIVLEAEKEQKSVTSV